MNVKILGRERCLQDGQVDGPYVSSDWKGQLEKKWFGFQSDLFCSDPKYRPECVQGAAVGFSRGRQALRD
jgi:hypothetical protein